MDTLRVDTSVAPPPLEFPAARPAPAPRPRPVDTEKDETTDGPESARPAPKSEEGSAAVDEAALRDAADELGSELKSISGHSLEISFEEEDSRYVVQILDNDTGEVLRQIPPQTLLEASRQLTALRGLLFDDRS